MQYSLEVCLITVRLWIQANDKLRIAASAFVDLYLAIYPAVILIKLQMSHKKKIALCAVLGFGAM